MSEHTSMIGLRGNDDVVIHELFSSVVHHTHFPLLGGMRVNRSDDSVAVDL